MTKTEPHIEPPKKAAPTTVKVAAAKGRPMLSWVGKRPLREVHAFPAQLIERFSAGDGAANPEVDWSGWPDRYERGGLLFHGDNKEVLAHLLSAGFRGKVDLVYIDPPFDSGADYVRRVQLRGASGTARLGGETYTLGEQIQYTDIWANDTYLQFIYERLLLLKELLSPTGSLLLHCDWRRNADLRLLCDEAFGPERLVNEIVWKKYAGVKNQASQRLTTQTDSIYWYSAGDKLTLNPLYRPMSQAYIDGEYKYTDDDGRRYGLLRGRGYQATGEKARRYLDEVQGAPLTTLWDDDGLQLNTSSSERLDFPTQKPEALVERIISLASNPGDMVLDCFIGSGTTAAVAQKLGRRWIGADINKGAIQTSAKRLAAVIEEQAAASANGQQQTLTRDDAPGA